MRRLRRAVLIGLVVTPLAFVPVHFSPTEAGADGPVNAAACQQAPGDPLYGDGTCCPSQTAICNIGGEDHKGYYAKLEGGDCY